MHKLTSPGLIVNMISSSHNTAETYLHMELSANYLVLNYVTCMVVSL